MATTQATWRDQQLKRLCWLLDTMIEHLDSAPPESALGGIEQYEDKAAELIETTGLADEAEIPAEHRPVLKRTKLDWVEVELGGITEKHPTRVHYRFTGTDGMVDGTLFGYLAASGLSLGPLPDPPRGYKRVKPPPGHPSAELVSSSRPPLPEPDERYIRGLVACLKGWRSRAQWKATGAVPREREAIDDPSCSDEWRRDVLAGEKDEMLSVEEAAGCIRMSERTIYRMMDEGMRYMQPENKPKSHRRIRKSDVLGWRSGNHPALQKTK